MRTRDDGACSQDVCGLVDNVTGYACQRDPCDGLDSLGACDGNVARWCDAGEVKQVDCTQEGGS